jgi:hypothetical protein
MLKMKDVLTTVEKKKRMQKKTSLPKPKEDKKRL